MVGWSDLSESLQQKCVSNMSFLSRINLRNSSKSCRRLVDSVPLKVPRVRFGQKKERYLVVIYTGVGEFVRVEFKNWKNESIVVERTDSNNPKVIRKLVKFNENGTYLRAKRAFISYLADKNFELGTLEIGSTYHFMDGMIEEILRNYSLNFDKISYDCSHKNESDDPRVFYNETKVLNEESFFYCIDQNLQVPIDEHQILFVADTCDAKSYKKVKVSSTRSTYYVKAPAKEEEMPMKMLFEFIAANIESIVQDTLLNIRFPNLHTHLAYNMFLKCPGTRYKLEDGAQMKRLPPDHHDFVHRFYMTKCGFYVQVYRRSLENSVEKVWPYSCGIGNLCKTHAEPFDVWYYSEIPRRLDTEPFWMDTIDFGLEDKDEDEDDSDDEDDDDDEELRRNVMEAMRRKREEKKNVEKDVEEPKVCDSNNQKVEKSEIVEQVKEKEEVKNSEKPKSGEDIGVMDQNDDKEVQKAKDDIVEDSDKEKAVDDSMDSDPDSLDSDNDNAPPTFPVKVSKKKIANNYYVISIIGVHFIVLGSALAFILSLLVKNWDDNDGFSSFFE